MGVVPRARDCPVWPGLKEKNTRCQHSRVREVMTRLFSVILTDAGNNEDRAAALLKAGLHRPKISLETNPREGLHS